MSPPSDPTYPTDVRAALLVAGGAELRERGVAALSLRAIAARAGVSRATPTWHFRDRAGLLTALAIEGFDLLGQRLRSAAAAGGDPAARFTALGRTYLDFGLGDPELFELMFRSDQLDREAPELAAAQRASFSILTEVARAAGGPTGAPTPGDGPLTPDAALPLLAWGAVHGLVTLIRGGALQTLTGLSDPADTAALAHRLVDAFTAITATGDRAGGSALP